MKTLACNAPYNLGGMGAHFAQIVEETRALDELQTYMSTGIHPDDELVASQVDQALTGWLVKNPLRFSAGLQRYASEDLFDRTVARRLTNRTETFAGFSGQFFHAATRARKIGFETLELHSTAAHIEYAAERYREAHTRWPIERSVLDPRMIKKQLREYEIADRIYVPSEYARQTFIDRGFDESKLVRTYLKINPRFVPSEETRRDETFRVIYSGDLTVTMGTHLLLEAFSRLDIRDAELILIGAPLSRGMLRYIEEWAAKEPRLKIVEEDSLPLLQHADCYVHPPYHDGYGYAPVEALYCGVPVILSEDTGAKENVVEGQNGYVVPTGSWDAILERLIQIYNSR
ncbi:MAG: glycosyltransferase family 4 protein [Rhodothermales bacterium]|nr:glycosyltransferase family 4 protein [Rhodothermales bacterium]